MCQPGKRRLWFYGVCGPIGLSLLVFFGMRAWKLLTAEYYEAARIKLEEGCEVAIIAPTARYSFGPTLVHYRVIQGGREVVPEGWCADFAFEDRIDRNAFSILTVQRGKSNVYAIYRAGVDIPEDAAKASEVLRQRVKIVYEPETKRSWPYTKNEAIRDEFIADYARKLEQKKGAR